MSDLIREVDEEIAKDKSEEFFEKWALPVGAFLVVVLVGLFFFFNWQSRSQAAELERANNFTQAIADMDTDPQASELLLLELADGGSGFAELSNYALGNALWNQENASGACDAWFNYAQNATNNENLRNSASFKVAWHCHGVLQPVDIIELIEVLEQQNSYKSYAPILRALGEVEAGNMAAAQTLLTELDASEAEDQSLLAKELAASVRSLIGSL